MSRPSLALIVALALAAAMLWLLPPETAQSQTAITVPSDWPYAPSGVEPGDSFRLLFVTSRPSTGYFSPDSTDIADYNTHVQELAETNVHLSSFSHRFRALISTPTVDARDNTGTAPANGSAYTAGEGVPIYWIGGEKPNDHLWPGGGKIADDYADFYDSAGWDSHSAITEKELVPTFITGVWTGSNQDGTKHEDAAGGGDNEKVRKGSIGNIAVGGEEISARSTSIYARGFYYAFSPIITVSDGARVRCDDLEIRRHAGTRGGWSCYVREDWSLIPDGIGVGERFRLMFVTSKTSDATYNNIGPYNGVAQEAATRNVNLAPFASHFHVLAHHVGVPGPYTARFNTKTRESDVGASEPIYWLGGKKVADNYADLFDGSWDSNSPTNEEGAKLTDTIRVWTGSNQDGSIDRPSQMGTATPRYGLPRTSGSELAAGTAANDSEYPFYALSPVMMVSNMECVEDDDGVVQECMVPADWAAIPDGLGEHDSFRLLYATQDPVPANYGNAPFHAFVQASADRNPLMREFSGAFRALISSSLNDARTNTRTRSTDVGANAPIHWMPQCANDTCSGAHRLARNYAAFYDGAWDYPSGKTYYSRNELGAERNTELVLWTGSRVDGTAYPNQRMWDWVTRTGRNKSGDEIDYGSDSYRGSHSIYGISPLLTVGSPDRARPAKPSGLKAAPDDEMAHLSWNYPLDFTITKYHYRQDGGEWTYIPNSRSTTTSHTVRGLANGETYTFEIRASDGGGEGTASDAVTVTLPQRTVGTRGARYIPVSPDTGHTGQRFRLLFVTSTAITGESTGIAAYNTHVQNAANNNPDLEPFADQFRAVISTADVDARDNTVTAPANGRAYDDGEGVAIYWMYGEKVADDYSDFYDDDWDSRIGKTESGEGAGGKVYTGSSDNGTKHTPHYAGAEMVMSALVGSGNTLEGSAISKDAPHIRIYGLSPVVILGHIPARRPIATPEPKSYPGIPEGLTATGGDGSATLRWTDPNDDQITGYEVYRFDPGVERGGRPWQDITTTDEGDTISYTESGLRNGTRYIFEVRAKYGNGNIGTEAQVYVTPAAPQPNRPPVFNPQRHAYYINANSRAGSAPKSTYDGSDARIVATDPDGDSLTYELSGEFASRFSIDGSASLTVAETPRLTIPKHTEVYMDVTVSDGNGGSARIPIKVNIDTDPNEPYVPPGVHGLTAEPGPHSDEATLTWISPNIVNYLINAFQIWREDAPAWTDIPGSGPTTSAHTVGGLTSGTTYKFRIRARAGNSVGPASDTVIATPMKAQRHPPVIGGLTYPGGGSYALLANNARPFTPVVTVSATDPDGDALTYELQGEHASLFSIDGNGMVTVAQTLNFSLSDSVSLLVEVADDTGLTARSGIHVSLKAAGEPVFGAPVLENSRELDGVAHATVARNAMEDTTVATVSATHPDGQTLTYTLLGSGDYFKIDSNGVIKTENDLTFNVERKMSVLVEVADEDGNQVQTSIPILVTCGSGEVMRGGSGGTICR